MLETGIMLVGETLSWLQFPCGFVVVADCIVATALCNEFAPEEDDKEEELDIKAEKNIDDSGKEEVGVAVSSSIS